MVLRKGFVLALVAALALAAADQVEAKSHHEKAHVLHALQKAHSLFKSHSATPTPAPKTPKPKATPKATVVDLGPSDSMDASGDSIDIDEDSLVGDESVDASGESIDASVVADSVDLDTSLSKDGEAEVDVAFPSGDGSIEAEFGESEDFSEDLSIDESKELDELIDLPAGAQSVRLRVHGKQVDLEVIVADDKAKTKEAPVPKKVTFAQIFEKGMHNPAVVGSAIGAVVAVAAVAGVAIAKRRNAEFERSVLALEAAEEERASASEEQDAPSDEATEEVTSAEAATEDGVVEGSV